MSARIQVGGPAARVDGSQHAVDHAPPSTPAAAAAAAAPVPPATPAAARAPADVTLHRHKGLWTLEEVLKLLRACGLVVELADQVPGGWQMR